ncbi:MAG: hypothetical protein MHPSP_004685, partial [Paramarteilia canceri]
MATLLAWSSVLFSAEEMNPCDQEKELGPCRARMLRFYFDKESNSCEEFFYGGCR